MRLPPSSRLRPRDTHGHLGATLAACSLVLCGFFAALHALTDGLEHWTFESLRRERARQGRLAAPPLVARTAKGESISLWSRADAARAVYLVDFVYTTCPALCQALGSEFTQMQAEIREHGGAEADAIKLVSLSFDIEHDRQAELAEYARLNHADSSIWTVAAPADSRGNAAVLSKLEVVVVPDGFGGYAHNGAIHLVDATGSLRGIYDYEQWQEALAAATRLAGGGQ